METSTFPGSYSEDEDLWLALGILEYGVGKWATILRDYGENLARRYAISLKDRYRTWGRQGIIEQKLQYARDYQSGKITHVFTSHPPVIYNNRLRPLRIPSRRSERLLLRKWRRLLQ